MTINVTATGAGGSPSILLLSNRFTASNRTAITQRILYANVTPSAILLPDDAATSHAAAASANPTPGIEAASAAAPIGSVGDGLPPRVSASAVGRGAASVIIGIGFTPLFDPTAPVVSLGLTVDRVVHRRVTSSWW